MMKMVSTRRLSGIAIAVLAMLQGCALEPEYTATKIELPDKFRNAREVVPSVPKGEAGPLPASVSAGDNSVPANETGAKTVEADAATEKTDATSVDAIATTTGSNQEQVRQFKYLKDNWVNMFQCPELNHILSEVVARNHDLKAAEARVLQARARVDYTSAGLMPQLNLNGSYKGGAPVGGFSPYVPNANQHWMRQSQVSLGASYEIDFWGKNRLTRDAAQMAVESSSYAADTVKIGLEAEAVIAYFDYAESVHRLNLIKGNLKSIGRILDIVSKRKTLGLATQIEVESQTAAYSQVKSSMSVIMAARESARNRLAVLMGKTPGELELSIESLAELALPDIPVAVPSQLLVSRPDIRKAEADLRGADINVAVAKASMLPGFSLTAERGFAELGIAKLFSPVNAYRQLGMSLTQNIFDGGRLKGQVDFSKAVTIEAAENYAQAVLVAVKDVEDSLAGLQVAASSQESYDELLNHSGRAFQLAQDAFQYGTGDYFSMLETGRTYFQAEDVAVQARYAHLLAGVSLMRGLGLQAIVE